MNYQTPRYLRSVISLDLLGMSRDICPCNVHVVGECLELLDTFFGVSHMYFVHQQALLSSS